MLATMKRVIAAKRDEAKENDKGFTLIELLVVVLIIGILAAIAIPVFLSTQTSARNSTAQSDVANARTAALAEIAAGNTIPEGELTPPLGDFTGTDEVTITVSTGAAGAFCIQGVHEDGDTTYAADASSGVTEGTCTSAGVRAD